MNHPERGCSGGCSASTRAGTTGATPSHPQKYIKTNSYEKAEHSKIADPTPATNINRVWGRQFYCEEKTSNKTQTTFAGVGLGWGYN